MKDIKKIKAVILFYIFIIIIFRILFIYNIDIREFFKKVVIRQFVEGIINL